MHHLQEPELREKTSIRGTIKLLIASIVLTMTIAAIAPLTFNHNEEYRTSILPTVITKLINKARTENKVPELTTNRLLEKAAKLKAADMVKNKYFAHKSPTGINFSDWIIHVGYKYIFSGENLAVNFSSEQKVQDAWLNSEKHRANMLSSRFTEIGVATAKGIYKGKPATFVVVMFAIPMPRFKTVGSVMQKSSYFSN